MVQQRSTVDPESLTLSNLATIYGCCGLFDLCTDQDLMSLSFQGQNKFLDWIGWELSNICLIKKNFITFTRPAAAATTGLRTSGVISNPCGDSYGVEWGTCDFVLENFGRLRRRGPVRDATRNDMRYCEIQPRYRLDGTPITSDAEYDMRLSTEAMVQDLKRLVISGSKLVSGEFDGLQRLVKTGYVDSTGKHCQMMDSIVIDWNGNGMNGGNGITWNGNAIANTYDFIDVLLAVVRRIMDRIKMAPALSVQAVQPGDMIIVAPTHLIRCILDAFTCWSVCPGTQYNEVTLQTYEARNYRNSLNGGMFQAGKIFLDGFEIPLMAYDWGLVNGPTLSDVYVLTGQVGSVKLIQGQFYDMRGVPSGYPDAMYSYTDGGRLLTWTERDKTCVYRETEMQPRMLMWAPWAQARIQDVKCTQPGGILSPDPWETSFYPQTSFETPTCPTDLVVPQNPT